MKRNVRARNDAARISQGRESETGLDSLGQRGAPSCLALASIESLERRRRLRIFCSTVIRFPAKAGVKSLVSCVVALAH